MPHNFLMMNNHSLHKKWRFSIKNLFRKCDQIRRKVRIWSRLLKKSVMENLIFCVMFHKEQNNIDVWQWLLLDMFMAYNFLTSSTIALPRSDVAIMMKLQFFAFHLHLVLMVWNLLLFL